MALNDHGANATTISFGGNAPMFAVAAEVDASQQRAVPIEGSDASGSRSRSGNLANAVYGPSQNQLLPGSNTPRLHFAGQPEWLGLEMQARAGIGGNDTNGRGQLWRWTPTPSPVGTPNSAATPPVVTLPPRVVYPREFLRQ